MKIVSRVFANMACAKAPSSFYAGSCKSFRIRVPQPAIHCRSISSPSSSIEPSEDVVPDSILHAPSPSEEQIKSFDPIARSKRRKTQLPPSRSVLLHACVLGERLINSPDINIARQNTTAALYTHINPQSLQIQLPVSTYLVPSPFPVSKKPTTAPSPPTS